MSTQDRYFGAAKDVVLSFLQSTLPFNDLPISSLQDLAHSAVVAFYPKGTLILEQDETDVSDLYLIQKGGVRVFLKGARQF